MIFRDPLYIGEQVRHPDKIIKKLKRLSKFNKAFVIIVARNADQLELHQASILCQKYYKDHPPYVIGIAADYEDALNLVTKITKDVYAIRQDANLKAYFLEEQTRCY